MNACKTYLGRMAGLTLLAPLLLCTWLSAPLRAQQAPPMHLPQLDMSLTYATVYANHVSGGTFWLEGGGLDLHAHLYRGLGVVAAATGATVQSRQPAAIAPLSLVTMVFGPRYTVGLHPRGRAGRVSVFGEALVGEGYGFHSLFSIGSGPVGLATGTTDSADSLALQTGGGVDLRLTRHLGIRAAQVDYLRTEFRNGSTNVQQNLRIAGGLVFRFH